MSVSIKSTEVTRKGRTRRVGRGARAPELDQPPTVNLNSNGDFKIVNIFKKNSISVINATRPPERRVLDVPNLAGGVVFINVGVLQKHVQAAFVLSQGVSGDPETSRQKVSRGNPGNPASSPENRTC